MVQEIVLGKVESIFGCFHDFVPELELLSEFWQVLFVEIESVGVSANVKESARDKLFRVSPKSVVEEISVAVVLKQRLPTFCHVFLQIANGVHLQPAPVENCGNSRNLSFKKLWLHSIVLTEELRKKWFQIEIGTNDQSYPGRGVN